MGHYEDFWYEITESIDSMGMKKEFNDQLAKMQGQPKHRFKETRDRWQYAHNKIEKIYRKKASK
jgi:hypothetical protein|tara:strand:+ start:518 stop:709 length:192 start_codon:yes stop_codon:yes gene_type:complete